MKSPALPLIAILAIPIVAVELGTALGVPPATYGRWYLGFGVVCVVVGVVIGVVGNALGPKPGLLDERAIDRAMTGNIVGLGLGFDLERADLNGPIAGSDRGRRISRCARSRARMDGRDPSRSRLRRATREFH